MLRSILFEISDDYNIEEANDDASDITTSLIGRFTEKKQAQKLVLGDVDRKIFENII